MMCAFLLMNLRMNELTGAAMVVSVDNIVHE